MCDDGLCVDDLGTGEVLVVWACRTWIACRSSERDPAPSLRAGFAAYDIPDAAGLIVALMEALASGRRRKFDFRCPCSAQLGADETAMLRAVAAAQRGRLGAVDAVLDDWLRPCAARHCHATVRGLAGMLDDAKVRLPTRGAIPVPRPTVAAVSRSLH